MKQSEAQTRHDRGILRGSQPPSTAPNILWICTDQQRYDTLGVYGNTHVATPNIDRLGKSGVVFDRAYCQSPICTPSRASCLTGRYPRTTGVRQNGQRIGASEKTVPRLLREAGYSCGLAGKLHLSPVDPCQFPAGEPRIDDGYTDFHWSHHPAGAARREASIEGERFSDWLAWQNWPANGYTQWLSENGHAFERRPFHSSKYVETSMPEALHHTTWCFERAMSFIELASSLGKPWLFSINVFDPHPPFDPPLEYLVGWMDRLDGVPLPPCATGELRRKPPFQDIDSRGGPGGRPRFRFDHMADTDHHLIRAAYWAMVELIDKQVGRVLEQLKRLGQEQNTMVILTSDHGEMLGDHGIYLKGPYFYEPAVRIPLLIAWPSVIPSGVRVSGPVELVDLAPTILEAVGLERSTGMQGRSLWSTLCGGRTDDSRDDAYCEFYNSDATYGDLKPHATMVATRRFKLVRCHGLPDGYISGELYDLEVDPGEVENLWDDSGYRDVRSDMLERLCDRMAWTVDPLPVREAVW